jgi:hypothetical protein
MCFWNGILLLIVAVVKRPYHVSLYYSIVYTMRAGGRRMKNATLLSHRDSDLHYHHDDDMWMIDVISMFDARAMRNI